eukprot:CAMPEP_0117567202 /NCGR_PEP_ID=MMETSP0784-20121206/57479_1 /TAXON_ID=39447 /ORGANISM="" /LENGTH=74 /DNA_ID=CAMNT_0005365053 /DNA_START=21 /DNA_END=246 /DNA_ORIENTATION=-
MPMQRKRQVAFIAHPPRASQGELDNRRVIFIAQVELVENVRKVLNKVSRVEPHVSARAQFDLHGAALQHHVLEP